MDNDSNGAASPLELGPSSPVGAADHPPSLSRCLVYCRLRPANAKDFQDDGFPLLRLEKNRVYVKNQSQYDYDGTFNGDSTQEQVFQTVAIPCIQHAFKGFCAALMCYGQTGTGKSYTMCNTSPDHEGIIPRAAQYIFDEIDRQQVQCSRTFSVVGQFVQIYRDHLGDLMTSDGKDRVDIYYDANDGVSLPGCSFHTLTSPEAFMSFYKEGNTRRVVTATAMNPESSRGHTAMVIWILSEDLDDPMAGKIKGKITFIDLAGYERFSKTGITNANPIMKDEARCINASLLALGHVVSSLSAGSKHIPWRDSKLTRILQDSIGGRSRTSIVLTVGPSSHHLYETTNSLQFGLRAMAVKVQAKASITVDYEKLANKLMGMLSEKDERISSLELQIASRDAERQELLDRYQRDRAILEDKFAKELQQLAASGATEEQIQDLKDIYEVEVQNLQEQQQEEIGYQDEEHGRELSKLIQNQKFQEAKSIAEMKLSQEHVVEEFRKKLESARGGTNDDLEHALQSLSEKDAVLASRAAEIAHLHELIDSLTGQVRDLGGVPDLQQTTIANDTYMDMTQVDELRDQLQAEVERHRNKAIDLRAQLDRVSLICNERMEENHRLRAALEQTGITEDALEDSLGRRINSNMVDSEELVTLQLSMQADIDELNSIKRELTAEVQRLRERDRENSLRSGSLNSNSCRATPHPENLVADRRDDELMGGGGSSSSSSAHIDSQNKIIQMLSTQLSDAKREKFSLSKRVSDLERFLKEHHPEEYAQVFASAAAQDPRPSADDSLAENAKLLDTVLGAKEVLLDAQQELILEQERKLDAARAAEEYYVSAVATLKDQLEEVGIAPQAHIDEFQPVVSLPLDEYMSVTRLLRAENRKLAAMVLFPDDSAAGTADEEERLRVEDLLRERDDLLELKDEMLLEKVALAQYVAKVGARLISQLESLGLTPCCKLPSTFMELVAEDLEQVDSQGSSRQKELEAQLQREKEEKERMNRLIRAFSAEREHQAATLSETAAKNKELEERELRVVEAYCKMAEDRMEKEQLLEEEARKATQELMEMQARVARQESARKSGVFDRLFGKLLE